MQRKVVLFELDALLDTRLPTLHRISEKAAQEALANYYMDRMSDDPTGYCTGITKQMFDEAYAARDRSILKESRPTMLMHMVSNIFDEIAKQKLDGDPSLAGQSIEIAINMWPYSLTKDEKINIVRMIRTYVSAHVHRYKVFDIPIGRFDLQTMADEDIAAAYVYNFDGWYTGAFNDLTKLVRSSAGATVYSPALLKSLGELDTIAEMKEHFQTENIDPFLEFKEVHQEFIYLDFLKSSMFSLDPRHLIPTS